MSRFKDLLDEPVTSDPFEALKSYREVVQELASAIAERYEHLSARAVLEPIHPLATSTLLVLRVFWPRRTEENAFDALTFKVTLEGEISALSADGSEDLHSEEELRAHMERVTRSHLRATLTRLDREARAPFTATLRTLDGHVLAANDSLVGYDTVSRDQLTSGDPRVSIEVCEAVPQPLNRFLPGTVKYTFLTGLHGTWRVVEQPRPIEGTDRYEIGLERVSG